MGLDRYKIGDKIGEGSFAKVYAAENEHGELVAIKVLDLSLHSSPKDSERIVNECKILQSLNHANIVDLIEIIQQEQKLFLVMEYVGKELFTLIDEQRRLQEDTARQIFHQLIDAVDALHSQGIVHRDLKPENILLREDLSIVLIDFGLSMKIAQGELLKTPCGSPCYAAPEMLEGKNYDGRTSDIWSCGVILYAMLCGYLPFEEENQQDMFKKILMCDYQLPRKLSAEARDLIRKILVKENRYSIEQIKTHPWWSPLSEESQPGESALSGSEEEEYMEEGDEMPPREQWTEEVQQWLQQRKQEEEEPWREDEAVEYHRSGQANSQDCESEHTCVEQGPEQKNGGQEKQRRLVRQKPKLALGLQTVEMAYQIIFDSQRSKASQRQQEAQSQRGVRTEERKKISFQAKPAMRIKVSGPSSAAKKSKYQKYL